MQKATAKLLPVNPHILLQKCKKVLHDDALLNSLIGNGKLQRCLFWASHNLRGISLVPSGLEVPKQQVFSD